MNNFIRVKSPLKKNANLLKNPMVFISKIKEKRENEEYLKYSTIIKKLRTENKLTISDLAKDICSISYLSKLENGVIQTNESTIALLFEKLGVDYKAFDEQNKKIDLHKILFSYLVNDKNALEEAKKEVSLVPLNIATPIINALYNLHYGNLLEVKKEIIDLEPVKETLSQFDSLVFLFIVVEYYVKTHNFILAYDYIKLMESLSINDYTLKMLMLENRIKVGYELDNGSLLIHSYLEYKNELIPTYPVIRTLEVNYLYNLYIYKEFPLTALNNHLSITTDKLTDEEKIVVFYYEELFKLKTKSLLTVYNDLIDHKEYFNDGRIMGLYSYIVFMLDKDEYYQELNKLVKEYDFDHISYVHQKFVCFVLMYGSTSSDSELLTFMKDELINSSFTESYHLYDEIYKSVYISLLASLCRYKEIYLFYKENS